MAKTRTIAIIGVGPRGGFALENLVRELAKHNSLHHISISLFEATGNFGNGPVYDKSQKSSNWININERILDIEGRPQIEYHDLDIESFPSYHDWCKRNFEHWDEERPDSYPPRSYMGDYLSQRFETLSKALESVGLIELYKEKVNDIVLENKVLNIKTDSGIYHEFDEVLLTIGHQPTEDSTQIVKWEEFASNYDHLSLFKNAYPIEHILESKNLSPNTKIGIRGFGLAMIDVVRAIAEHFGEFITENYDTQACSYRTSHNPNDMLTPFSLDGLPPVPKPLNARIDKMFKPSESDMAFFKKSIGDKDIQKKATSIEFLVRPFAKIAAKVYLKLPNAFNPHQLSNSALEIIIAKWLNDQSFEHTTILPRDKAEINMRQFVDMATDRSKISLDYCIGQVWRHCQPTIYEQLSFNECPDEVFKNIIELDESSKRYSYGPPVAAIQQLLALIEAEVLNLHYVDDPDIECISSAWKLTKEHKYISTTMMIDSVLAEPQIKAVKSALVSNLLDNKNISVFHDKFGLNTNKCGYLLTEDEDSTYPIALLGRLAKGTIIGVDAILECFGNRSKMWAKQAAKNHTEFLENCEKQNSKYK